MPKIVEGLVRIALKKPRFIDYYAQKTNKFLRRAPKHLPFAQKHTAELLLFLNYST
jgi:hypothetical protein